jgi:hypothetical protein
VSDSAVVVCDAGFAAFSTLPPLTDGFDKVASAWFTLRVDVVTPERIFESLGTSI